MLYRNLFGRNTTLFRSTCFYRREKPAEALSIEYRTNIVNAIEEVGKVPAATHVRNIQRREEDRILARSIKYIKGKFRKPGTTFVTQQQTDGNILEIPDKIPLEKVIIEENLKKNQ